MTICLVTNRRRRAPVEQAAEAAASGVDIIQIRERDLNAREHFGPTTAVLVEAARRRGIPVRRAPGESVLQLGLGRRLHRIDATLTDRTSVIATDITSDKDRTKRVLARPVILALCLAARLGLSCRPRWLRRIRATPQQTQQTPAGRRENVRGAFRASGSILKNRTVLLVDDVFTTGATLHESARTLRDAGAACIVVAVLARAGID